MTDGFKVTAWDAHRDGSALAGFAAEGDPAAEQCGALPHAEQTDGLGIVNFLVRNPPGVVLHFEDQMPGNLRYVDFNFGRVGVADDIGQGLLKDPEERRV